jgi:hypothetical protein
MRRFLHDTGIAALHLDRKRGVFERAAAEVARGNRVGIAAPVLVSRQSSIDGQTRSTKQSTTTNLARGARFGWMRMRMRIKSTKAGRRMESESSRCSSSSSSSSSDSVTSDEEPAGRPVIRRLTAH